MKYVCHVGYLGLTSARILMYSDNLYVVRRSTGEPAVTLSCLLSANTLNELVQVQMQLFLFIYEETVMMKF